MLDIFAEFATDESAEVDGVEMEYGDAKLLIARSRNKVFMRKFRKLYDRNQKLLDRKDDAAEKLEESIMIDCIATGILKGWSGLGYKGAELPYSLENAKMLLAHRDFREKVTQLADDIEAFKVKKEAEEEKN